MLDFSLFLVNHFSFCVLMKTSCFWCVLPQGVALSWGSRRLYVACLLRRVILLWASAPTRRVGVRVAAPLTTPGDQRGEPDFRCATISQQKASLFGLARLIVTISTQRPKASAFGIQSYSLVRPSHCVIHSQGEHKRLLWFSP